jgi:hypothetical protein
LPLSTKISQNFIFLRAQIKYRLRPFLLPVYWVFTNFKTEISATRHKTANQTNQDQSGKPKPALVT